MLCVSFLLFTVFFVNLEGSDDIPQLEISINPQPKSKSSPQNGILLKRVEDTLNLTCRIISPVNEVLPKYDLQWHVPTMSQNREHRVTRTQGNNMLTLAIHNLLETDSGNYTCEASRPHSLLHGEDDLMEYDLKKTIRINVKSKKTYCSESMFQCPTGNCISKRFLCDGKEDCKNGADEAEYHCGPNPCGSPSKVSCPDGRCIPKSWCCEPYYDPNCTIKEKLTCCPKPFMELDPVYQSDQQRFSDMGFLQTTIYAVVGSAMAFMFIVTVLIIAICRIHLKRHTNMTRCTNNNNNRVTRTHHHIPNLYDLDMCINRPFVTPTDELTHTPGFLVTYNINNGVQFVGRPVNPPPYCEVVSTPPREGPPPPYISHENLPRATAAEENAGDNASENVRQEVTEEVEEELNEEDEVTRPLRSEENNQENGSNT